MDLMFAPEVSKVTRVPEATLRWWAHKGDVGPRSFKVGRRRMYKRADVEAWIEQQYQAGVKASA